MSKVNTGLLNYNEVTKKVSKIESRYLGYCQIVDGLWIHSSGRNKGCSRLRLAERKRVVILAWALNLFK